MNIKVSILIPIYKAEKYIDECLHSVFKQTYDNIEYIFVNDASPDHSIDIVRKTISQYPKREPSVKIIENSRNFGVAQTRNILINNATGDYIYFVDSDDFIKEDAIELFVSTALKENADIVRCNFYNYKGSVSTPVIRKPKSFGENMVTNCLSTENMKSLWLLFIRKKLFTDNHLTFQNEINACEDYLMTIKLFYYANRIVDIKDLLYYYRLDNNNSITQQKRQFHIDSCKAVNEIIQFLKEKYIFEENKEYCLKLMFLTKQHFLINKSIRDVDTYIKTFPESNSCYKFYNYNKKQKLLFILAEHNLTIFIKLFVSIISGFR